MLVGYSFYADTYCVPCGELLPEVDPEGNDKYEAYSDSQESGSREYCGICLEYIEDWPYYRCDQAGEVETHPWDDCFGGDVCEFPNDFLVQPEASTDRQVIQLRKKRIN